ncbi:RraA family protein [Arenivirga flava]|uniref:Putative 4-hydroxy-4-methyl-2-oxoglutarate aldolase n=1 Tax=Arenivirga flava TaxID=1930060 RepID=A0AA37UHD2_9MICO|nr:RraA family protein [Arenivirga flava]GMA28853.1 diguanylate cyclase [Arenivirga flava]
MGTDSVLRERFAKLDTAAVSDALDQFGLPSGVAGLPLATAAAPVIGYAVTAVMEPYTGGAAGAHILTDVVDRANDQDVLVIDNGGRLDVSTWGGILALGAVSRGVRGVLIDGACRDVEESRQLGLPVYARGAVPATARGRLRQRSSGEPARLLGRTVHEGDVVFHDDTGFVVVPAARVDEVLAAAEAVVARERAIADEIRRGAPLHEAMHDARLAGVER